MLVLGIALTKRQVQKGTFVWTSELTRSREKTESGGSKGVLDLLEPLALWILHKGSVLERFPTKIYPLQHVQTLLYGQHEAYQRTKMFLAQQISYVLITLLLTFSFAALKQDVLLLSFGLVLCIVLPFFAYQQLLKKNEQRKQKILLDLPEFLNQLILLVNAGETVPQALKRVTYQRSEKEPAPLTEQLLKTVRELENNVPFPKALEELNRRCAIQEVSLFTTTVLLNYRRGGNEFIFAMRILAREMWEKRKAITKALGEQASSKLVFPMVLIFGVVLVILATPAMLML